MGRSAAGLQGEEQPCDQHDRQRRADADPDLLVEPPPRRRSSQGLTPQRLDFGRVGQCANAIVERRDPIIGVGIFGIRVAPAFELMFVALVRPV